MQTASCAHSQAIASTVLAFGCREWARGENPDAALDFENQPSGDVDGEGGISTVADIGNLGLPAEAVQQPLQARGQLPSGVQQGKAPVQEGKSL